MNLSSVLIQISIHADYRIFYCILLNKTSEKISFRKYALYTYQIY